jgi:hypothetical protein
MLGDVERMLPATGVDTFEDGVEARTRLRGRTMAVPFIPEGLEDEDLEDLLDEVRALPHSFTMTVGARSRVKFAK